jgi:hypothetical protein
MIASRRAEALYRNLPAYGWEPIVVTTRTSPEWPGVIAVEDNSYVAQKERSGNPTPELGSIRPRRSLGRIVGTARTALKYAMRLHPRWFDGYGAWSMDAAKAAVEYGRQHKVDIVWATLSPQSLAWAAVSAARELGVPCVLDFRDPVDEDFPGPKPWLTRALRAAAQVTVAAPMVATPYIVTNAQHPPLTILSGTWHEQTYAPEPSVQFRVVFAGSWHYQFDTRPLFDAGTCRSSRSMVAWCSSGATRTC